MQPSLRYKMNVLGDQLRWTARCCNTPSPFAAGPAMIAAQSATWHPAKSWHSCATRDNQKRLTAPQLGRRGRLEAVLFLSREPIAPRKLAQLANLTDGTEARTLLESLRKRYDERGCAFQVVQVAGGYQLLSRPEFATWLRAQAGHAESIRLSPPALETLAVVAYRQPVFRAEVEAIRGVACGEILRQLMDRDFVRIVGRSEELGRPLWYGTTKRFLQAFGLCNLDQLPWAQQLRRSSAAFESGREPHSGEEVAHAA
jgi:segregation and condensation protein B